MSARLLYREGQLLASADLRDALARDDRLRALHVRAQHRTWGIAQGLAVSVSADRSLALVAPGLAFDGEGRDLLVASERGVPVPPVAGPARLALLAVPARDAPAAAPCGHEVAPRRREQALLAWRDPQQVPTGTVVLAVARVQGGHIDPPLERRGRRYARSLARPRMATGSTEGRSAWSPWTEPGQGPVGLELTVDTSDAGFRTEPFYFASLAGPAAAVGLPGPADAWPFAAPSVLGSGHLGFVAAAHADRFVFRLAGGPAPFGLDVDADAAQEQGWHVRWLAVESAGGEP